MILATVPFLQWLVSWIEDIGWIAFGLWVAFVLPKRTEKKVIAGTLAPEAATSEKKKFRWLGGAMIALWAAQFCIHLFSEHK